MNWGWDSIKEKSIQQMEFTRNKSSKLQHEIRSMLHALLGYLEIFHEEVEQKLSIEQNELLDRIMSYADSLANAIDEMLVTRRTQYD